MKKVLALLIVGLLGLSGWAISGFAQNPGYPVELMPQSISSETVMPFDGEYEAEPHRDPGPHNIIYDDGNPRFILIWEQVWSRVIFTPNQNFELQAIRFMCQNQNGIRDAATFYVYTQDGNDLDELVLEYEYDETPYRSGSWITIELDENDYPVLEAEQDFSIVYGPAPGGHPDDGAEGWWPLTDDGTQTDRSFIARDGNAPPERHRDWTAFDGGDILLRANGEYVVQGIDLQLDAFDVLSSNWSTLVGGDGTAFEADISNLGDVDAEGYIVSFRAVDLDGEDVWSFDAVGEMLESGESTTVESEPWVAEAAGHYVIHMEVIPFEEDVYMDNNAGMIEQIALSTDAPDTWIGYTEGVIQGTNWQHEAGEPLGSVFYHPGGDQAFSIAGARFNLLPQEGVDEGTELDFQIFRFDPDAQEINMVWEGTAETIAEEEGQWLEVELSEEEQEDASFFEGQSMFVTYVYADDVFARSDETPPVTNQFLDFMEPTSVFRINGGWQVLDRSDMAVEVKVVASDARPEGPRLAVEPEELNWGTGLEIDEPHVLTGMFIGTGTEEVEVTNFRLTQAAQEYFSVEPDEFVVAAGETSYVDITFQADTLVEFQGTILVQNTSINMDRFFWPIYASTIPDVQMEVDPESIDFGFGLDLETDYVEEVEFSSVGDAALEVEEIVVPNNFADYFTVEPAQFTLEPGEMQTVTITFNSADPIDIRTAFTVINNSINMPDYELEVRASSTPTKLIGITPLMLEFGSDLEWDMDHSIEAYIKSTGEDTLNVMDILIDEEYQDYFTLSNSMFMIPPGDSAMVTVTFSADTEVEINTDFHIMSDAMNMDDYAWEVHAATVLSVSENVKPGVPGDFSLSQNYPNPFNPVTKVDFALPNAAEASFRVFDMSGRAVLQLQNGRLSAGYHSVEIDASSLVPGVYLYRLQAGNFTGTRKMVLLK